jgi:hypothetical protein
MANGLPRARIALLLALGLALLAGAARVRAHYRSTPGFRAWARATPVEDSLWRAHVPAGVELGRGASWRSDAGPPRSRFGQWRARTTVAHGGELLLDLEVEVRVESREVADWRERGVPSEAFEGLAAFVVERGRDPDFHGVAVLTLFDLSAHPAGAPVDARPPGPDVQLDVFALAGPGEVELVVQEIAGGDARGDPPLLGDREFARRSAWGAVEVMAQLLSLEDPPAEGIAYQARTWFHSSWSQVEGGAQGAGRGNQYFAATTRLYSARLEAIHAFRSPFDPPDRFGLSTTASVARSFKWNGDVW